MKLLGDYAIRCTYSIKSARPMEIEQVNFWLAQLRATNAKHKDKLEFVPIRHANVDQWRYIKVIDRKKPSSTDQYVVEIIDQQGS